MSDWSVTMDWPAISMALLRSSGCFASQASETRTAAAAPSEVGQLEMLSMCYHVNGLDLPLQLGDWPVDGLAALDLIEGVDSLELAVRILRAMKVVDSRYLI